nr:ATP-binding protein [Roseateles chitosanitabidus]
MSARETARVTRPAPEDKGAQVPEHVNARERHAGSLRLRLLVRLALQSMSGLGAVCVAVYLVIFLTLDQRQDETLAQKREAVTHLLTEQRGAHDLAAVRHLLTDFLAGHDELTLRVADREGQVLLTPIRPMPAGARAKQLRFDVALPAELGGRGTAVLVFDKRRDDALLARLGWTLILAAIGGTVVLSAAAAIGVRRELAPLRALVKQAAAVGVDRLELRLDGRDQVEELQPLILQINELLDRLAGAYRQMESFNADVAHELNTPIAILVNSCELALRRPRSPEELKEALASNLEELHRIARIVADMLFLANAQRGATASREEEVELSELAAEVIDYHEDGLRAAHLGAVVRGEARARVDAGLLQRAIANLVSNATRYATPGTVVEVVITRGAVADADGSVDASVSASASPGAGAGASETMSAGQGAVGGRPIRIDVVNVGAAIAPKHLPRLFDRFYRVDPSRSGASRHHGLGLSIVAAVARMHGGRAEARSSDGVTTVGFSIDPGPLRA